jgi:hypothetical protein
MRAKEEKNLGNAAIKTSLKRRKKKKRAGQLGVCVCDAISDVNAAAAAAAAAAALLLENNNKPQHKKDCRNKQNNSTNEEVDDEESSRLADATGRCADS